MAEDDSEERWWEPSDAELEDLIEDRLADGPLIPEPAHPNPSPTSPTGVYVVLLIMLIASALGNNLATVAADNLCNLSPILVILVYLIYASMKNDVQYR